MEWRKCLGIDSLLINSQIFVNFFLDFWKFSHSLRGPNLKVSAENAGAFTGRVPPTDWITECNCIYLSFKHTYIHTHVYYMTHIRTHTRIISIYPLDYTVIIMMINVQKRVKLKIRRRERSGTLVRK